MKTSGEPLLSTKKSLHTSTRVTDSPACLCCTLEYGKEILGLKIILVKAIKIVTFFVKILIYRMKKTKTCVALI